MRRNSRRKPAPCTIRQRSSGTPPISVSGSTMAISTASERPARVRNTALPLQEHVAGAVDFGGEIVGAAVIGVQFDHQSAVRLLDRLGIGPGRQAENGIGLVVTHVAARWPGAASSGTASIAARPLARE